MRKNLWMSCLLLLLCLPGLVLAQGAKPVDSIPTDKGELRITFLGHGTLMFQWNGKTVHVDPWSTQADYAALPKADLVLVTHEHRDHLDGDAIKKIRTDATAIGSSFKASATLDGAVVLKNGDEKELAGVRVLAVPAYNREARRPSGEPFHPLGEGNGYVLFFGNLRVYIAGDTEVVPEMAALKGVDVAFLPVNQPYTMTIGMAVEAARMIQPRFLYPYHTGDTNLERLAEALKAVPGVETRFRPMK